MPDIAASDYADAPRFMAEALEARRLVELQDRWLNSPGWVERVHKPGSRLPETSGSRRMRTQRRRSKKRTPTNSTIPAAQWLADAHAALDVAVVAAYAAPADIANNDALRELLALNVADSKRAARRVGSRGEAC